MSDLMTDRAARIPPLAEARPVGDWDKPKRKQT
jgi:hypothetical protein